MYNIAAKPTKYNGVQFRSRLEARWAAFFDLCGWKWDYEPIDLRGYIPDFIIRGHDCPILAEVKPIESMNDPVFIAATEKIDKSGWKHEALILTYFLPDDNCFGGLSLGWLREIYNEEEPPTCWWAQAIFHETNKNDKAVLGFCHEYGIYADRISGYYDGDRGVNVWHLDPEMLWREAGNLVQWHPR